MHGRVICHHAPPVTIGPNASAVLPDLVGHYGPRVAVVTDPVVAEQAFFPQLLELLRARRYLVSIFQDISPDPPFTAVEACRSQLEEFGPHCVVGIGGGSVLDATKVGAMLAVQKCEIPSVIGIDRVPGRGFPTVLVPTTAGTGSEVTPIAVLTDEKRDVKRGIVSPHLVADHAIIDPKLCLSLPPWPTAYTGMDALTHAIEAYTSTKSVPLVDDFALAAIRSIVQYLPRAVADGSDLTAREAMSRASMLAGLCLGPVNTAAVHALAYPLGARFHVPHGVANALLLPHVMDFNLPVVADRYREIARAMNAPNDDAVTAAQELTERVGTNKRLRDLGIEQSDIPILAADAIEVTRLIVNNPREVTRHDAERIYEAAW